MLFTSGRTLVPGQPLKATRVLTTPSRSSDEAISTPVVPKLAIYALEARMT